MMVFLKTLVVLFLSISIAKALQFTERSLEGTETSDKLTDKQLAMQRWFAGLTYLKQNISDWEGWGKSVRDLYCDGNTCIRYEIADLAYAAALLGLQTPSYKQVAESIMYDSILRMIQQPVWQYIELFDDFKSQTTYPDPVAYKNIMYSGHLVQILTMFEAIFLNDTFSSMGWDFLWTDPVTRACTMIHYNTSLLIDRVFQQSLAYGIGGVPCEPDSIFVICNNYPQNGWLLYDNLRQSNYTVLSIPSWHKTVKTHGINRHDREFIGNYFKLDYLIKPLGIWEPIGSIGSDMWALSWMKPWWPISDVNDSLVSAFQHIVNSLSWMQISNDTNDDSGLFPQAYLHPSDREQNLFPFDDVITTSFYPMTEKQFLTSEESLSLDRYRQVLRYFEANYGKAIDFDGDDVIDSYQYNSITGQEGDVGDYSIWATSNLLIGMIYPKDDVDYLRNFFQGRRSAKTRNFAMMLESVEYPHVMVAYAESSSHRLTIVLKPGDNPPIVSQTHDIVVSNVFKDLRDRIVVKIDDNLYTNYDIISEDSNDDQVKLVLHLLGWNETAVEQSLSMTVFISC